jgi:hypothetical protein
LLQKLKAVARRRQAKARINIANSISLREKEVDLANVNFLFNEKKESLKMK